MDLEDRREVLIEFIRNNRANGKPDFVAQAEQDVVVKDNSNSNSRSWINPVTLTLAATVTAALMKYWGWHCI